MKRYITIINDLKRYMTIRNNKTITDRNISKIEVELQTKRIKRPTWVLRGSLPNKVLHKPSSHICFRVLYVLLTRLIYAPYLHVFFEYLARLICGLKISSGCIWNLSTFSKSYYRHHKLSCFSADRKAVMRLRMIFQHIYRISSNKRQGRLLNYETVRCDAY